MTLNFAKTNIFHVNQLFAVLPFALLIAAETDLPEHNLTTMSIIQVRQLQIAAGD